MSIGIISASDVAGRTGAHAVALGRGLADKVDCVSIAVADDISAVVDPDKVVR
jgi:archaellum component FlaG (FlaF/FlaG flagellin family)